MMYAVYFGLGLIVGMVLTIALIAKGILTVTRVKK
jgi:uncharacterized protein YebE (UPF0316 family)